MTGSRPRAKSTALASSEALGTLDQAGRVYLFTVSQDAVKTLPYVTQDSEGVAGNACGFNTLNSAPRWPPP